MNAAAYAYHALVLGYSDEEVNNFFYEGLPAFLSANVVDFWVKNFEIHPTTTPEQDLAEMQNTGAQ